MDGKRHTNASEAEGVNSSSVQMLAKKQAEFEDLLAIQAERRQKEEAMRQEEQRFAMREERLVREAYQLAMMKASFHAEKISWKRSMEDQVREEEDTRRAMEDARRAVEDQRRKQEEQVQMALDSEVKLAYEQSTLADRAQKERVRRWIEEDRVRALEDVLIRQDVVDLRIHASLRNHVHKHFDALIGYGVPTKEQVDAQIDALLDLLFETPVVDEEGSKNLQMSQTSSSLSSSGVLIEHPAPTEAPPSYQSAISSPGPDGRLSPPHGSSSTSHSPLKADHSSMPVQTQQQQQGMKTPIQPPPPTHPKINLKKSNIEVDDFAVLEDDDMPSEGANTPSSLQSSSPFHSTTAQPFRGSLQPNNAQVNQTSSPLMSSRAPFEHEVFKPSLVASPAIMSTKTSSNASVVVPPARDGPATRHAVGEEDEDPEFVFDMSIESSMPLVLQEDWEVVYGRMGEGEAASSKMGGSAGGNRTLPVARVEGVEKSHTEAFRRLREENVKLTAPAHTKQLAKMMSDTALKALLDPKLSDYNPFSKLVLSTRDTWESCDQCGTYFDRMSIKQTCRTCHRNFCSKCGTFNRRLDLSLLTSRISEHAHDIRALFPKTKEDSIIEAKCCTQCDKTLKFIEAKDAHTPHQRSHFFIRQYEKASSAKIWLIQALQDFEKATREPRTPDEIHILESNVTMALRRYQSCIDSCDQTITTLRSELPINPKTGARYTNSTEIRTLTSVKTAMNTFLLESKQISAHCKIRLASKHATSPALDSAKIAASVRQLQN
jgi:hypothetical protein